MEQEGPVKREGVSAAQGGGMERPPARAHAALLRQGGGRGGGGGGGGVLRSCVTCPSEFTRQPGFYGDRREETVREI